MMKRHKRSATVSACAMPCCTTQTTATKKTKKGKAQKTDLGTSSHDNAGVEQSSADRSSAQKKRSSRNAIAPTPLSHRPNTSHMEVEDSSESDMDSVSNQSPVEIDSSDSDSDYIDPMADILNNHSRLVTGTNTFRFSEPVSTPISYSVSKSIARKIKYNKFIDFANLLPTTGYQTPSFALTINSKDQLSLAPSNNAKKIYTIDSWTSAFLRFVAIYSSYYPHETPQLMKYGEIVRDLAHRRPGMAWSFYDSQFRMSREHAIIPWDTLHTEFWVMATTQPTMSNFSNGQSNRPFRAGSGRFPRNTNYKSQRQSKFLDNTCWTFNKRGLCREPRCPHPHVCGFCRGSHHSGHCSFNSKEQASTTTGAQTIIQTGTAQSHPIRKK
ncbi:uncharacterized protein LOC132735719 [Ruditapes philippinarum]|uniref:uncharacterized protein LOC132735719 n=1 Tax=Ruditapes philippinarum TaxID=129788 RepID=UPI00295BB83D|nr:uncharacterized protein LOC132735719 [Ruditapes philippinarum]